MITIAGLTLENKTYIDEMIRRYGEANPAFWKQFFAQGRWTPGHKTFSHRKHVRPVLTTANLTPLTEGKGTSADTITIAEWTDTVENYGTHINYSKESLQYAIDDVVEEAINSFETKAIEIPEALRAAAMCKSNFQMTAKSSVKATFDAAKVILDKKLSKQAGRVAVVTPEVLDKLKGELEALGTALPEAAKAAVITDGEVFKYDGFEVVARADDAMYGTAASGATPNKIVFIAKTRDNELPGSEISPEIAVYDNGLGKGVIEDPNNAGTYINDTNNREGSVALDINHFGCGIQADLGHLVCSFSITDADYTATYPTVDPVNGATSQTSAA